MSNVDSKGLLQIIAEGGIPQILAGPAGAAISRLVGATVEIPAAWLEQKAQAIRDETSARSKVMDILASRSAELGLTDQALLHRGLDRLLGKAYREQTNREAVAALTIEELRRDPPPIDGPEPTDDWMSVFEAYAEKASSSRMRWLWARVLSGELRKPSSFSFETLHLVSILDGELARSIAVILGRTVNNYLVLLPKGDFGGELYDRFSESRAVGIVSDVDRDTTLVTTLSEKGRAWLSMSRPVDDPAEDGLYLVDGKPGSDFEVHGVRLSRVGRELAAIAGATPEPGIADLLIDQLKASPNVTALLSGRPIREKGKVFLRYRVEVWRRGKD